MKITLDAGDFAQLADFWTRAPDITRKRLMQFVTVCDLRLKGALQENLPKGAAGAAGLAGSIQTEEQSLNENVIGMVASALPYAQYVEFGTRPHTPPIQPLIDWAKVKFGLTDAGAKSAAFAIRSKIAKKGTQPNPVWRLTWQSYQDFIRRTFDGAMAAIARDLAGGRA